MFIFFVILKLDFVLFIYKGVDDIKNIVIFYCGCCGYCIVFFIKGKMLYFVIFVRKNVFF